MIAKSQLLCRLGNASAALRQGSVKFAITAKTEKAGKKVQTSWGSAMRR